LPEGAPATFWLSPYAREIVGATALLTDDAADIAAITAHVRSGALRKYVPSLLC